MIDSYSGSGTARAQGTPAQSHISPRILGSEDYPFAVAWKWDQEVLVANRDVKVADQVMHYSFENLKDVKKTPTPLGPYRRPMPRVLGWS